MSEDNKPKAPNATIVKHGLFHITHETVTGFSAVVNSALFLAIITLLFQTREELVELRTTIVERYVVQEQIIADIKEIEEDVEDHERRIFVIEKDFDRFRSIK
jgi:hypothetical protein